ncbi:transcription factor AP-2 gamma isoform 1 [Aphelenchoides avenae]|nr:transcription factor AP-2 gamma isoform 1 [Aphelenchus avenae]
MPQQQQPSGTIDDSTRKRRMEEDQDKDKAAKQPRVDAECSDTSGSDDEFDYSADDAVDLSASAQNTSYSVGNMSQFLPTIHSTPMVPKKSDLPSTSSFCDMTTNANAMFGQFASGHLPPIHPTTPSMWSGLTSAPGASKVEYDAAKSSEHSDSSGVSSLGHSSGSGTSTGLALAQYVPPTLAINKDRVFATLNAKLNLLGSKKYDVTVGEILRRIQPPEALNSSFISGYLRRAKNGGMGEEVRTELKQHGINLPLGRRKNEKANAFTSLVEKEAWVLAKDYDSLSKKHFPTQAGAANILGGQRPMSPQMLKGALDLILEAIKLLDSDRSPGSEKGEKRTNEPGPVHLDPATQAGLTDFSLRTHGFGVAAHQTAWQSFANVLQAAIQQSTFPMPTQMKAEMPAHGYPMPMPSHAPTASSWDPAQMAAAYQQFMAYNQLMMGQQQLPKWMTNDR